MDKKYWVMFIILVFLIGGLGGVFMGRFIIPYVASVTGWEVLNKLATSSPIVVTRTQQVQLNEGVNLIDLVKQAGNITVTILDPENNFLGNGVIVTGDGLIFSSTTVLGKQTAVTVVVNDGQKFPATIKSKDTKTGLAILSIGASGMATAQFEPATSLSTAQRVIYLGRGNVKFEHEALAGFMTQSLANQLGVKQITTDAELSGDYFGGPIINLSGHVVGLSFDAGHNMISEDLQNTLNTYLSTSNITQ